MSVSSMTRSGEDKAIYVLFQDGEKMAELTVPGHRVVYNSGFEEEEIAQLIEYATQEQDAIFALAKQVNPMRAFLGGPIRGND